MTKDVDDPAFPHGTERGYFRGCRVECCLEGKRLARKRRALLEARGTRLSTPVGPVRSHVQWLLSVDPAFSVAALARAADVAPKTVWSIDRGDVERVRTVNASRILALEPGDVARECRMVPSHKPLQQVKSMMRLGHRGEWIGARLGYARSCGTGAPQFVYKDYGWMTRGLADRIDALAREVGDSIGPSPITAKRAARRGWRVPGAYDERGDLIPGAARDDTTDDVEGRAEQQEQRRLRDDQVHALYGRGVRPAAIMDHLSLSSQQVYGSLKRLSRQAG